MKLKSHEDYVPSIFVYTKKKTQSQISRATRLELWRRARTQTKKPCSKEIIHSSQNNGSLDCAEAANQVNGEESAEWVDGD